MYLWGRRRIVWGKTTLLYLERQESFVKLNTIYTECIYDMGIKKKPNIFNIDLLQIKNEDIKENAAQQISLI